MKLPDIPEKRLRLFFDTAWERHRIHVLKTLSCPKPWTDQAVFQNYRFCNVFRKIDKTTAWLIQNVINPNQDNPLLWKTIMLYRYISKIETYEQLEGHEFDYQWIYTCMRNLQTLQQPIFTTAFILNTKGAGGTWMDRVSYIFTLLKHIEKIYGEPYHFHNLLFGYNDIEQVFNILLNLSGVGPFMAYQYCMDFTYAKPYLLNAGDRYIWTHLGLGAVRGMNRLLHGNATRNKILFVDQLSSYLYTRWVDDIFKNIEAEEQKTLNTIQHFRSDITALDIHKMYAPFSKLHMGDVEHWLCEFDKWCRGGSKKRRFQGT